MTRPKKRRSDVGSVYGKRPIRTQHVRIDRARKQKKGAAFFGVLLALGFFTALTWVGFYFFGGDAHFNDKHIRISIDTPRDITSGDDITLTIHYKNAQDTELTESEMRIKPPEGFILKSTEPQANGNNEYHFKLGKLSDNESGQIIVKGQFIGSKDGNDEITTYFTYRPENFNSNFEKVTSAELNVKKIPIALSVAAPDSISAGAQTPFKISVKNTSNVTMGPIAVSWILPDPFDISSIEPETENDSFLIESIEPGNEWKGSISGTFKNSAQGEHQLAFNTHIIVNNKQYLQNEVEHFMEVTNAELEAHLLINDFEKKGSIAPGQTLNLKTQVTNNSTNPQENVVITLEIEEPIKNEQGIINWEPIKENEETRAQVLTEIISDNRMRTTLTWNAENTEQLANIDKESTLTQSINLNILTPQEYGGALPGNTIIINMNAASNGGSPTHTAPFEVTLRSDTNLQAQTQPAGDPIVGVGPDGLTEVSVRPHDVHMLLTNSLHEIQEVEILIYLPTGVAYERPIEIPAGEIQFIKSKRAIRWILNKLPTNVPQLPLSFRIDTITAIGDQEPKTLIKDIELTAIDAVSQNPFKLRLGSIERK